MLIEDLNLWRFVPKMLTEQQKELQKEIAEDMLDCANHDPEFIQIIINGDETWVYVYDPETKFQSSQWKHPQSPRPKKARQVRSNVKVMLTCFFDYHIIVHHEYAAEGRVINKEYYVVFEMLFEESGQTCGQQRIFSSNMIMPPLISHMKSDLFSSKTTCHLLDRRLTLPTWLCVISGCSQN